MSHKRPSLLLLVTQLERAGAQKVAFVQARYFHRRGYKVILCFFYDKYGLLTEVREQEPYKVVSLGAKVSGQSRPLNALRTVRALWRLYWLLRRERIQVVETLTHYSNVLGIIIAWLAGVPVRISSQRNSLVGFPRWFLFLDSWLANSSLTDKMVAVSEQTRRFCVEVENMDPQKVTVIPNGVDLERFDRSRWSGNDLDRLRTSLGTPANARVVITVARLHPQKGHSHLIEAASYVRNVYPDVLFLLVGDGEMRSEIKQHIRSKGLSDHFRILGVRSDVPRLLALSDLFVLSSIYEGMPHAVLEAMATMLPVIATNVDGTREVVADEETGLLVPPAESRTLGNAIISLLEDATRRWEMGQRGYERVQAYFSEQMMCRQYEELIHTLLKSRQEFRSQ